MQTPSPGGQGWSSTERCSKDKRSGENWIKMGIPEYAVKSWLGRHGLLKPSKRLRFVQDWSLSTSSEVTSKPWECATWWETAYLFFDASSPGPCSISFISPGAGDWVAKVSPASTACLYDLPSIKKSNTRAGGSFPSGNTSSCGHVSLLGELGVLLCNCTERESLEACV